MKLGNIIRSQYASKEEAQNVIGHLYAVGRHTEKEKARSQAHAKTQGKVAKTGPKRSNNKLQAAPGANLVFRPRPAQKKQQNQPRPWTVQDTVRKYGLDRVVANWYRDTLRRFDLTSSVTPAAFANWAVYDALAYEKAGVEKGLGCLVQAVVNLSQLLNIPETIWGMSSEDWARKTFKGALHRQQAQTQATKTAAA
jgi:hypothetical protein